MNLRIKMDSNGVSKDSISNSAVKPPPNVVIFTMMEEADTEIIELIQDYFKSVEVTNDLKVICHQLLEPTSKLFIFLGDNLALNLGAYFKCLDITNKVPTCKHKLIAGITKEFEQEAFQAYQDHIIDNYILCRPMYARIRVVQIVENLLQSLKLMNFTHYSVSGFTQASTHYPEELTALIQKGMKNKSDEHQRIIDSSEVICDSLDTALSRISNWELPDIDYDNLLLSLITRSSKVPLDRSEAIKQKTVELLQRSMDYLAKRKVLKKPLNLDLIPTLTSSKDDYSARKKQLNNTKLKADILIVEDDMLSLQLSKTLLRQSGANVHSATTASGALALTDNQRFDLILLDINLPDQSGVSLLEDIIDEDKTNYETPIVMLTGNTTKAMVDSAISLGAKAYLVKPLKSITIKKLFRRFKVPSNL